MKLKDIIKNVNNVEVHGSLDTEITNITSDSRNIKPQGFTPAVGLISTSSKLGILCWCHS